MSFSFSGGETIPMEDSILLVVQEFAIVVARAQLYVAIRISSFI